MPEPDQKHIQWIAERLRYRVLGELIGREVAITSLNAVGADVSAALADVLPAKGRLIGPDQFEIKRSLTQYLMLDLTFEAHQDWLDESDCGGVELLDSLGFIMDAIEAKEFDVVAALIGDNFDDPTLLGELEADLQEGQTVLRLLLRAEDQPDRSVKAAAQLDLPRHFSIVDACLTNAESVWLHKYMMY